MRRVLSPRTLRVMNRRRLLAVLKRIAAVCVMLLAMAYGLLCLMNQRELQLFGELVARVETSSPVVALTFDDGPEPGPARELLRVLSEHAVKATFFLEGRRVEQNLEIARAIVAAGHELGNHSYSHRRMILKCPAFIADEIERTDRAIRAAGYRGPIHFRPPYGKKLLLLPWYLMRHERTTVMWDVEPEASAEIEPEASAEIEPEASAEIEPEASAEIAPEASVEIAARSSAIERFVQRNVRPGSIVLLHVMQPQRRPSLRAVTGIITGLQARGYRFVTVSALLAQRRAQLSVRHAELTADGRVTRPAHTQTTRVATWR